LIIVLIASFFGAKYLFNAIFPAKAEVKMPPLVGLTLQEAQAELASKNILIKTTSEQNSDTIAKGRIIIQIPVADMKVKENTPIVELIISKGKNQVDTPDLVNKTLDEAKTILDQNQLRYSVAEEPSDEVPIGSVIRHTPSSGWPIDIGSVIELYVSSGPATNKVLMPGLIGKKLAEAKRIIENNNLVLKSSKFVSDTSKSDGIVIAQSVEKDTSVEEGTEVVLTVNRLTTSNVQTQTVYINLSNKGIAGVPFNVKVEVSGGSVNKKVIYEKTHTQDDGEIGIPVSGNGTALLRVYIDNVLDSEQVIQFN
jgi:serine/threonine-protein kinase